MRYKLISCEIFYREMCAAVARSPHQVDVDFLPKGLHDMGAMPMRERLQRAVDTVDASRYNAILMGYALCGNGLAGLRARSLPLVVPRAHDCITLFLGSKERYLQYFQNNPGTYFKTTGWIERGEGLRQLGGDTIQGKTGVGCSLEDLIAKYGDDNGRYLYEQLGDDQRHYRKMTFIEMGVEPDDRFERRTREEAARRRMAFEKLQGDMSLFQNLVDGVWDSEDFLVVEPGCRVVARYNRGIVSIEKAVAE
jgi:hypothetical protein